MKRILFVKCFLIIALLFAYSTSFGQECNISLSGFIKDHFSESPLEFSNILIEEIGSGGISDTTGFFEIKNLCPGEYHLRISHISCETNRIYINLTKDTLLDIEMDHHAEFLQSVIVEGHLEEESAKTQQSITGTELAREGGKPLAEIVQNIAGVSSLKNGSGIAKPVIHGLYGNRISVLNNGIVQAGQQWGNDHAPEIDPFSANRVAVLKGVDAIPYGGNGLGGIVLVEPGFIRSDPHMHGTANYIYHSNNRMHILSTRLEKSGKFLDWRFTGTYKYGGDQKSPNYYLRNTGVRERNFSVQLHKNTQDKWFNDFYYSFFNTELGILRGSHVGNLTDLEAAIDREVPFFTEDEFSYRLEAPRQLVNHHLVKLSSKYYLTEQQSFHFTYGGQLNRRKEFDVRRSGRSEIPALDLFLQSHFFDFHYSNTYDNERELKTGLQFKFNDSDNQPGTGVFPLLPDYLLFNTAAFLTYTYTKNNFTYDLGGRYDFRRLVVSEISQEFPFPILRHRHNFFNYSLAGGIQFKPSIYFNSKLNLGLTQRSPEVNELYSAGLHQGVSGIEEGDSTLQSERAFKVILTNTYTTGHKFIIESSFYYQIINNYIFLEPQDRFRLTIRGAFPVFLYKQTNATIRGLDLMVKYEPIEQIQLLLKYAMVRGTDTENNLPLVYMPADNLFGSLGFTLPDLGKLHSPQLSVSGRYVFRQSRLEEAQDFLAPPDAYFLLGLGLETQIQWNKADLNLGIHVDNLLDTEYRDYLNRLRYYADEAGRNVRVNVRCVF